jgi:predicted amidohydrolase
MLTIALLQAAANGNDLEANRVKGEALCRKASALGADIALFPEMWSVGYMPVVRGPDEGASCDVWRSRERWEGVGTALPSLDSQSLRHVWGDLAIARDHPFVLHFRSLARELCMAIALTYLERWDPLPRNTMSLIDRYGEIVLTYAKVHTCDFDQKEAALTPGDDFHVCSLDTAGGQVKVGAMICYDREFPESARVLMLKGAEILLVPNACEWETNRHCQLRTRAYENMTAVAMTNYPGPGHGHSCAFDGVGFGDDRSRDMLIVEVGEVEGVYLAGVDVEALRDFRSREAWGNTFRRPHRYTALTAADRDEPFVRVSVDGQVYHETRGRL